MSAKRKTYWNSNHRWTYIWIAITQITSPTRVYELAHGILEAHNKDHAIMHALKKHGIIRSSEGKRHHHHHHHSDSPEQS